MATPTLSELIKTYAETTLPLATKVPLRQVAPTSPRPIIDTHFSPLVLLGFYQALLGDITPTLDDLTQNLVLAFAKHLDSKTLTELRAMIIWDLKLWFTWLYENSSTWADFGAEMPTQKVEAYD